jgi:flavin-binding protein dodecin
LRSTGWQRERLENGGARAKACEPELHRVSWEEAMSVARVTEITASSKKSFQDAIEKGIARAAKTLKNVEGAWIQDQKIVVENGQIAAYRVNMKVTFILAD